VCSSDLDEMHKNKVKLDLLFQDLGSNLNDFP